MSGLPTQFTIIRPLEVTPEMLVSTNVMDENLPAWSGASAALGDQVIHNRSVWECKLASSAAPEPVTGSDVWMRVRSVNSWACLDRRKLTPTAQGLSIQYVFRPGQVVNAVSAIKLVECDHVRVRLVDPTYSEVYNTVRNTGLQPAAPDWYSYLIAPWVPGDITQGLFLDLPSFPFAELHVEFVGTANMQVGALVFGTAHMFGLGVKYGLELGGRDMSSKDTDQWGNTEFVERFYADTITCEPVIHAHELVTVHETLKSLRATPALYIVVATVSSAVVYAKLNDFRTTWSNARFCDLNIQLESLLL